MEGVLEGVCVLVREIVEVLDGVPERLGVPVWLSEIEGVLDGVILGLLERVGVFEGVGVPDAESVVVGVLVRVPEPVGVWLLDGV
jgi:hypothetical protein